MRTLIVFLILGGSMASGQDLSKLVSPDAKVVEIAGGFQFTEGPVWMPGGFLVFSDTPANELRKWSQADGAGVFRSPANNPNGNTLDTLGRLVTCETGTRRVTVTERDGTVSTLVARYQGKRFNSPNDVIVKSDGTIWFTDPDYNVPQGEKRELDHKSVYCFDPGSNAITIAAGNDFDMPNGLCFSPDEKRLYIADSGKPHHIRVFEVEIDGTLKGGSVFCVIDNGAPDGFRCDEFGNVWSTRAMACTFFRRWENCWENSPCRKRRRISVSAAATAKRFSSPRGVHCTACKPKFTPRRDEDYLMAIVPSTWPSIVCSPIARAVMVAFACKSPPMIRSCSV